MRTKITLILILVLSLYLCGSLLAQAQRILHEGEMIRVAYDKCNKDLKTRMYRDSGTIIGVQGDLLVLKSLMLEKETTVPLHCVKKWWLGEARYTHRRRGIRRGVLIGAAGGFGVGMTVLSLGPSRETLGPILGIIAAGIGSGSIVGRVMGAWLSDKSVNYRWSPIIYRDIRIEPLMSDGTVGLGLVFAF